MSYILDALRRADAERQRGDVPGLHAQPGTGAPLPPDTGANPRAAWVGRPLNLALLGGAVLAALVLAWWLGRGQVAPAAAPAAVSSPPVSTVVAHGPAPAPVSPAPVSPAPAPALVPMPMPVPAQAPAPAPAPPPAAAPPAPAPITVIVPVPVPAPAAMPPAPASPPAAAASEAVLPLASLSEATRRSLPALAWSGVVFADRAEQRLVVVNGQVAREGDEIAAGLQLLQIRAKSVVLRWRGQRIELPV